MSRKVSCRATVAIGRITDARAGKVKPLVDSVFSFEDTLKAYERIKTGRATGKVVVKVDPEAE